MPARVLTTGPALDVRLAIAGAGLTLADESRSREPVARGELAAGLEAVSTPFPGFYLSCPRRRHASPALRALVDHRRRERASAQRRGVRLATWRAAAYLRGAPPTPEPPRCAPAPTP